MNVYYFHAVTLPLIECEGQIGHSLKTTAINFRHLTITATSSTEHIMFAIEFCQTCTFDFNVVHFKIEISIFVTQIIQFHWRSSPTTMSMQHQYRIANWIRASRTSIGAFGSTRAWISAPGVITITAWNASSVAVTGLNAFAKGHIANRIASIDKILLTETQIAKQKLGLMSITDTVWFVARPGKVCINS